MRFFSHPTRRLGAQLSFWIGGGLLTAGLLSSPLALAAPPPISLVTSGGDNPIPTGAGFWGFVEGLDRSQAMLGDLWGARTWLSRYGASLAIQQTSESLGNVMGGLEKGFTYNGLTQMLLQVDTNRGFGHYGGLFNVSALDIQGRGLSATHLGTLQTASGIEAEPGLRLWEFWYEQKFLEEDRLDVKVGQQSLDQEFMVSANAQYFVNTMLGWPMLPSADLPGGGPAYPLSALGLRLSARPVDGVQILAGVFNGTPLKNGSNDHGTSFPLGNGALLISEVQFSYPSLGTLVDPEASESLGWTYRLGGWYDTESFGDPASTAQAQQHSGNYALYAAGDHLIWRDSNDPNRTLSLFGRVMGTPLSDRNLISASFNFGALMHSPLANRPMDTAGLAVGLAKVSSSVTQVDRANNLLAGTPNAPIRTQEKFIELTYQFQYRPWLLFQPDLQYVSNPGAGVADPNHPDSRLKNEWVLGLRTILSF